MSIFTLASTSCLSASTRAVWIVLPPLIVGLWAVSLLVIWKHTEPGAKRWLVAIFLIGFALGALAFYPHAPEHDQHLPRFLLVLGVAAVMGGIAGLLSPATSFVKGGWVAMAGNVVPIGATLLLLIWLGVLSGGCTVE